MELEEKESEKRGNARKDAMDRERPSTTQHLTYFANFVVGCYGQQERTGSVRGGESGYVSWVRPRQKRALRSRIFAPRRNHRAPDIENRLFRKSNVRCSRSQNVWRA